jgi:hypothetical protein
LIFVSFLSESPLLLVPVDASEIPPVIIERGELDEYASQFNELIFMKAGINMSLRSIF